VYYPIAFAIGLRRIFQIDELAKEEPVNAAVWQPAEVR
jgi:hypothetical protein